MGDKSVIEYRIDAQAAIQIKTPLLVSSPENEQFGPDESDALAETTPDISEVIEFTEAEALAATANRSLAP